MGENLRRTYPKRRTVKITVETQKTPQELLEEMGKIDNDIELLKDMSLNDYVKQLAVVDLKGQKEKLRALLIQLVGEM